MINMDSCRREFNNFIKAYDMNNEKIDLKYNHTMRVMKFCEKVAKSLKLSEDDINLAKLIGLLHDIGRFEQIKNYDTYNDLISIDHGDLGSKILRDNDYISKYTDNNEYKEIILLAVMCHNKFDIDKAYNERTKLFCKIIRDADKLDIIDLFITNGLKITSDAGNISEAVMNSVMNNEAVDRKDIVSRIDSYLEEIGLVFDLNFNYSIEYVYKTNSMIRLINKIIDTNMQEKDKLLLIRINVIKYINSRMGVN